MKRFLTILMLTLLTGMFTAISAEDLYVAGTKLDLSKTYSQAYLNGLGGGNIDYSPSARKLTLYGVTITRVNEGSGKNGIDSSVDGLTISFRGINSMTTDNAACIKLQANTTLENDGTVNLTCTGSEEGIYIMNTTTVAIKGGIWKVKGDSGIEGKDKNQTVEISDDPYSPFFMTVNGKNGCIWDLKALRFNDDLGLCHLKGTTFKNNAVVDTNDNRIKNVDLVLGLPAFYLGNYFFATGNTSIEAPTITGTVSYSHSTKTLTMNNATIGYSMSDYGFQPLQDNMTLVAKGNCTIQTAGSHYGVYTQYDLTLQCNGTLKTDPIKLKAMEAGGLLNLNIKGGGTLSIDNTAASSGWNAGIGLNSTIGMVYLNGTTLNIHVNDAYPCSDATIVLNDCVISDPVNAILNNYEAGQLYQLDRTTQLKGKVKIEPGTKYDLWVNGVRVNSKNYNKLSSVLSSGSCSYSPSSKTLTLNNAKITYSNDLNGLCPALVSQIEGLTIKTEGTSELKGVNTVVNLKNKTTLTGGGHLKAITTSRTSSNGLYAICHDTDTLIIDHTELTAQGDNTGVRVQNGRIISSYLHLSGTSSGFYYRNGIESDDCLITVPVGGYFWNYHVYDADKKIAKTVEIVPKSSYVTGVGQVETVAGGCDAVTRVYTTSGQLVWQGKGSPQLPRGIYIVKQGGKARKVQF